ncbi:hypothetical protein [Desulfosarcina variabilis]|uniref:hypothetical protein n=1 Tax=Desulfosarcina variabilis TaxID=2300 RepID=UPI003AFB6FA4
MACFSIAVGSHFKSYGLQVVKLFLIWMGIACDEDFCIVSERKIDGEDEQLPAIHAVQ